MEWEEWDRESKRTKQPETTYSEFRATPLEYFLLFNEHFQVFVCTEQFLKQVA